MAGLESKAPTSCKAEKKKTKEQRVIDNSTTLGDKPRLKMKILESQNAILTNYEVFQHLQDQRKRYAKERPKGRRPGNLETVVKEVRCRTHSI
jgi:hypothetical protein